MSALKQQIMATGRLTQEELTKRIDELIKAGKAINEHSALNTIRVEIERQKVESGVEQLGYFLSSSSNQRTKEKRIYLANDDGVLRSIILHPKTQTVGDLDAPCAVKVTNCDRMRNVFTAYEYFVTTEKSKIMKAEIVTPFIDCVAPLSTVQKNGLVLIRGRISQAWPDKDWKQLKPNQKPAELPELPILDKDGKVHLSLVVADRDKSIRVSVPNQEALKTLLDQPDLSFLHKQNGKELLVNALKNLEIVAFGRISDENKKGEKVKPYMNIAQYGWMLQQTQQPARDVAESGEEEEGIEETD